MDGKDKHTMTHFSVITTSHPDWDKKIEAGLRKECESLTGIPVDSKTHSIYVKNGNIFTGGIHVEPHGSLLWIDSFWVEPAFRKQGIGKKLLQEAHLFAMQQKATEMQLNTYFSEAHAFFLTCGFEDVAIIPNWKYSLTCYLMKKML